MVEQLTGRSKQISAFPHSGRMLPEFERGEIREIIEGTYRIIYRIKSDEILILAVMHCARILPPPGIDPNEDS
jgi:plasmid stabilization system protein ParE